MQTEQVSELLADVADRLILPRFGALGSDDIEEKKLLFRAQLFADVSVGAGNNFVVLSATGGEAPSEVAAVKWRRESRARAISTTNAGTGMPMAL